MNSQHSPQQPTDPTQPEPAVPASYNTQMPAVVETKRWPWATAILSAVVGGAVATGAIFGTVIPHTPTEVIAERHNTLTVESIQRDEKVVLLSLGIQGINEASAEREVLGVNIPGSKRTKFIQYSYRAQLGIDGHDVSLKKNGEDNYTVVIPKFEFIGHSNEKFQLAVEDKGVLSWVTPDVSELDQVNAILNEKTKKKHIEDNKDLLQAQARDFYEGIIHGIDPDITVNVQFR